jgi:ribokinase
MFDTISLGSATLDVFLKSAHFLLVDEVAGIAAEKALCLPYGSKLNVDDFALQSGGGATNTAVAFARLGFRAAVVAEVGQDLPAQIILQEIQGEGVDTSMVVQEKSEDTAISALLVTGEGGRSVVTARGASKLLTVDDVDFSKLQANWIHLSSLGNVELVKALARHCQQKRIRFSWNPGGAEIEAMVRGELHLHEVYPTLLCVNEEEAGEISGAGYDLEMGGATVVITNGQAGGRYFEKGRWFAYEVEAVRVVQETGAGDSFLSGMVAAYLCDRLTPEAIEWGKAQAKSVIGHMGAKTGLKKQLP